MTTKAAIVELAERTAEAGTFARELQILIGPTKFDQWFVEQRFDCSLQQAKAFIRFTEKRAYISDSFRKTLLNLPDVGTNETRQPGEQKRQPESGCRWLSLLMKAREELTSAQEKAPIEDWDETHVIVLVDALKPFAKIYEKWHSES